MTLDAGFVRTSEVNLSVPAATLDFLKEKGIRVEVARTSEAVELFNNLQKEYARIVAALHLTC